MKQDNRWDIDGRVLEVIRKEINSRPINDHSTMTQERRDYLLNTPRQDLTPSDKRLQSMLVKYGSINKALENRDRTNMVLGGYIGGKRRVKKGFARLSKEEVQKLAYKGIATRKKQGYKVRKTNPTIET